MRLPFALLLAFYLYIAPAVHAQVFAGQGPASRATRSSFAGLGTPGSDNVRYCTDCLKGEPVCTGGGTGAVAWRINGAWNCAGGARTNSAGEGIVIITPDGDNDEIAADDAAVAFLLDGHGAPVGACTSGFYVDVDALALYYCKAGAWSAVGGGGGSGSVTFSTADASGSCTQGDVHHNTMDDHMQVCNNGTWSLVITDLFALPNEVQALAGITGNIQAQIDALTGGGTVKWSQSVMIATTNNSSTFGHVNLSPGGTSFGPGGGAPQYFGYASMDNSGELSGDWFTDPRWVANGPLTARIVGAAASAGSSTWTAHAACHVLATGIGSVVYNADATPITINYPGSYNSAEGVITGIVTTGCPQGSWLKVGVKRTGGGAPTALTGYVYFLQP